MSELCFPWIELSVLLPLIGALHVSRIRDAALAQRHSTIYYGLTLATTLGAWFDFTSREQFQAHDHWGIVSRLLGDSFVIDELSAPLLPLASLVYLLTAVATLRTKVRRFSFDLALVSESILLATLSCQQPWGIIGLMAAGTVAPLVELRTRRKPTRVFVLHMSLFIVLLVTGWAIVSREGARADHSMWGVALVIAAVLLRSGIAPVHCWMTDLFEHASFGTALLFVTPMVGAYSAVRLILPVAPDWALRVIALMSLATAVYAAGMALVQREARRFFCYLFLSHSSLVLVGLAIATPIGLTGALCVWLSVGLALAGFGLVLRALESRIGRLSLVNYHGLYDHTPTLAALFLLTGLASVGFPGTFGFVGTELLVDGTVQVYPYIGSAVVLAAGLNGVAVIQTYFRLFTGTRHTASISLRCRSSERIAVLILTAIILGRGLYPQPGVSSRFHAARRIFRMRQLRETTPARESSALSHSEGIYHTSPPRKLAR